MTPADLVAWAFFGGISLLILTIPVTVFVAGIRLAKAM